MFVIIQPSLSEINQLIEKIKTFKDNAFNGWRKNDAWENNPKNNGEDNRALLKDGSTAIADKGENGLRNTLGNFKSDKSGNVSSTAHLYGFEPNCILKPGDYGNMDFIESQEAVIQQGADELRNYSLQVEAEKEKYRNAVSEISLLKSEVVCLADALLNNSEHASGFSSSHENAISDLKATIEELRRQNTLSAEKIVQLEQDKCVSESTLNETTDRIIRELNILKTELQLLQNANSKLELELDSTHEILKNGNGEKKLQFKKNESLTHDLENLGKLLDDLTDKCMPSEEQEKKYPAKDKGFNGSEHELDGSTSEQKDLPQRTGEQEKDIEAIVEKLYKLKRQNTALDLHIEKTLRPNVSKTEPCPSDNHLVTEQYARETSYCDAPPGTTASARSELETAGSCSDDDGHRHISCCAEKDRRIKEVQRKLDELEEEYADKARRYQKVIGKIEAEARMEKKRLQREYKSNTQLKDNHIADIIEGFRIFNRTKGEEIERERNNAKDATKQCTFHELGETNARERVDALNKKYNAEHEKVAALSSRVYRLKRRHKGFSKPAKYRPPGSGKNLANPGPPPEVVEIPAAEPKSIGPSGDDQRDIPAIRSPVVEPRIPNAPVESESKTSSVIAPSSSPCGTNEAESQANTSPAKKTPEPRSSRESPLLQIYNQHQRERDQRISKVRETYKLQRSPAIPMGLAHYTPTQFKRWKL